MVRVSQGRALTVPSRQRAFQRRLRLLGDGVAAVPHDVVQSRVADRPAGVALAEPGLVTARILEQRLHAAERPHPLDGDSLWEPAGIAASGRRAGAASALAARDVV